MILKIVSRILIFLLLEFYLTVNGLDDFADYVEYIDFIRHHKIMVSCNVGIECLKI